MSSSISPVNAVAFWPTDTPETIESSNPWARPCASFIDTLDANVILGSQFLSSQRGCLEIQEVL